MITVTQEESRIEKRLSFETAQEIDELKLLFKIHCKTAIHEAGHAVVGEVLGFPCRHIRRQRGRKEAMWLHDRRTTRALRGWPKSDKSRAVFADYATAVIAGVAAEAVQAGIAITDELRLGPGEEDYKKLAMMAHFVSFSRIDLKTYMPLRSEASLIAEWESRAIELVKANWDWIESVAWLYLEDDTPYISGGDVRSCRPSKIESEHKEGSSLAL